MGNMIKNWAIIKYDLVSKKQCEWYYTRWCEACEESKEESIKHDPYRKYDSLEEYKKQVWFKESVIRYHGGRGRYKPLHEFLYMDETDEELILEYLEKFCNLSRCKFKDPDDLIFKLNKKLDLTLNPTKNYVKDKKEFWKDIDVLISSAMFKEPLGDCEDYAIFKYCCFKVALKHQRWWHSIIDDGNNPLGIYGEGMGWRLRLVWSELIHREHHVHLAWCRGTPGKVGWFPLESTYHPEKFEAWWNSGVRLEYDNPIYTVLKTWTDQKEYSRLL